MSVNLPEGLRQPAHIVCLAAGELIARMKEQINADTHGSMLALTLKGGGAVVVFTSEAAMARALEGTAERLEVTRNEGTLWPSGEN